MTTIDTSSAIIDRIPRLADANVQRGQRWIYSAGCNVDKRMSDTSRIDCELDDLRRLADAGARVAILSHQGEFDDGSAQHLDHLADYLGDRLARPVQYFPTNATDGAVRRAAEMSDGEIVVFGNTRFHGGEQCDAPELAERFARLGDYVAVGGFSKAHRSHASNVGLLRLRPGWATDGLVDEAAELRPWAGPTSDRRSVAVVGGVKKEKTTIGLDQLRGSYDLVVPGGIVLNTLLAAGGVDVAESRVGGWKEQEVAQRVLAGSTQHLHMPSHVVVSSHDGEGWRSPSVVPVDRGVPAGHAIVDFVPRPRLIEELEELRRTGGRAVIAGPPALYAEGFREATETILTAFADPAVSAMLLGGDTVKDLPWKRASSTGGGSALQFLATGTCAVFDALLTTPTRNQTDET
ncbi:phosphoglycerate kinase [Actinopolyspora mzabensis]|uniref:Phosphoglycerate kinase n=1 Tax=Actinopolyspora mzabensis TaxID=995066 RepID=A0A1G9A1G2_ACTMZ|nr:phosphoglycerate kinase [Actinopolyspora mzabensis]SDK21101.1 phosphoglycerate kinase [Actinopolyspora mzabensis]